MDADLSKCDRPVNVFRQHVHGVSQGVGRLFGRIGEGPKNQVGPRLPILDGFLLAAGRQGHFSLEAPVLEHSQERKIQVRRANRADHSAGLSQGQLFMNLGIRHVPVEDGDIPRLPNLEHPGIEIDAERAFWKCFHQACQVLAALRSPALLITRGCRGMALFQKGKPPLLLPIFGSSDIVDVTGAGDTVIATLTMALVAGASFEEAAMIANHAAGIVVSKLGTATVTPRELIENIREDPC